MASQADRGEIDLQEQLVRIREMGANTDRLIAENQKLNAESQTLITEVRFMPRAINFQAMIAFAAILGAGAAIAKLFFS